MKAKYFEWKIETYPFLWRSIILIILSQSTRDELALLSSLPFCVRTPDCGFQRRYTCGSFVVLTQSYRLTMIHFAFIRNSHWIVGKQSRLNNRFGFSPEAGRLDGTVSVVSVVNVSRSGASLWHHQLENSHWNMFHSRQQIDLNGSCLFCWFPLCPNPRSKW